MVIFTLAGKELLRNRNLWSICYGNNYGSNPNDIIAVLGPSIGKNDFEVDMDVKELFENEFNFHNEIISKKIQ